MDVCNTILASQVGLKLLISKNQHQHHSSIWLTKSKLLNTRIVCILKLLFNTVTIFAFDKKKATVVFDTPYAEMIDPGPLTIKTQPNPKSGLNAALTTWTSLELRLHAQQQVAPLLLKEFAGVSWLLYLI